jgi:hypothetical protein
MGGIIEGTARPRLLRAAVGRAAGRRAPRRGRSRGGGAPAGRAAAAAAATAAGALAAAAGARGRAGGGAAAAMRARRPHCRARGPDLGHGIPEAGQRHHELPGPGFAGGGGKGQKRMGGLWLSSRAAAVTRAAAAPSS